MKIRLAGFEPESVVDGPGIRFVIFTQGCPHFCAGCHNPQTHNPFAGEEYEIDIIKEEITAAKGITGITISGGEPFLQPEALSELVDHAKSIGLHVVVYSGYIYEDLLILGQQNPSIINVLEKADILIDGPFIKAERDISLAFRGSRNQRIIDLNKTRSQGYIVTL